jgi:hypothetical protein
MESDACYFRRRAREEFESAKSALSESARAAHFEMAERYSQLAAAIDAVNEQIGPLTV